MWSVGILNGPSSTHTHTPSFTQFVTLIVLNCSLQLSSSVEAVRVHGTSGRVRGEKSYRPQAAAAVVVFAVVLVEVDRTGRVDE